MIEKNLNIIFKHNIFSLQLDKSIDIDISKTEITKQKLSHDKYIFQITSIINLFKKKLIELKKSYFLKDNLDNFSNLKNIVHKFH